MATRSIQSDGLKTINQWYPSDEMRNKVNGISKQLANLVTNIKEKYGVKADGSDETTLIQQAIDETASAGKKLYFPNGNYGISATLQHSTDLTSTQADDPILWEGESAFGVRFVACNSFTGHAVDLTKSKKVNIKNFISSLYIQVVSYDATLQDKINSQRQVHAENVFCDATTGEPINWGALLTTPAPPSYTDNGDGTYSRYPLEIYNFGGYNAIMITNKSVDASGNIINGAPDNSAIGIVDRVQGVASPVILIDGTKRSNIQFKNSTAPYVSGVRSSVVYEVDQLGHLAIGASTVDDPNAPGTATVKIRDSYPIIKLFDANRNNHEGRVSLGDDFMYVQTTNDADGKAHGLKINYKTGEIQLINGTLTSPNTTITTASTTVNAGSLTRFTFGIAMNIEAFTNGISGQVIHCIATVTGVVVKNRAYSGQSYIYTNTGADVTLQTGRLYTFVQFEDGWYMQ